MEDKIRVLMADQDPLVRAAVRMAIASSDGIEMIADTVNAPQTIVDLTRFSPDVLLVDMDLPGGATRVIEWASRQPSRCQVLVLAEREDEASIIQILDAGASGYLSSRCTDTELIAGIRAACEGGLVMPAGMLSTVLRRLTVGNRNNIIRAARAEEELQLERDAAPEEHTIINLDALEESRSRSN